MSSKKFRFNRFIKVFIFLFILLWCAGFSFPWLFVNSSLTASALPFIKYGYSIVCHQLPEKSFAFNGVHFFVCARCTGIYAGALAIALLTIIFNFKKPKDLKLMIVSILPLLADVILHSAGIYPYNKAIAFLTGLFSGSVVFIYILFLIENFFAELKRDNGQK